MGFLHPSKHKKAGSKLSQGPRNMFHKAFVKNQKGIHKALHRAIGERRVNLKAVDICELAQITPPTFYLHCRDTNEALHSYETELKTEFSNLLPVSFNREAYFTMLLAFVRQHKDYFGATFRNHDLYLLSQIIDSSRSSLVSQRTTDRTYANYTGALKTIIVMWGNCDHFSKDMMPTYTKMLLYTRITRIDIKPPAKRHTDD